MIILEIKKNIGKNEFFQNNKNSKKEILDCELNENYDENDDSENEKDEDEDEEESNQRKNPNSLILNKKPQQKLFKSYNSKKS